MQPFPVSHCIYAKGRFTVNRTSSDEDTNVTTDSKNMYTIDYVLDLTNFKSKDLSSLLQMTVNNLLQNIIVKLRNVLKPLGIVNWSWWLHYVGA